MSLDPQQPPGGGPEDPNQDQNQNPNQGNRRGSRGARGEQGQQRSDQGAQSRPNQDQDRQRGSEDKGAQHGSYQQQGNQGGSRPEHGSYAVGREEKPHHKSRMPLIAAGIVGLLLLGGLIGGLVAAFGGNSTKHVSSPTHPPTTHAPAPTHAPVANSSAPTTSGHLLEQFQNIGSGKSNGFAAPAAVSTHYIYRCPTHPGAFDATMANSNGSDSQTIAKTGGPGGTNSVALHPKFPGSTYHIAVNTKCEYRVQVFGK
jgi:hypothetical protein